MKTTMRPDNNISKLRRGSSLMLPLRSLTFLAASLLPHFLLFSQPSPQSGQTNTTYTFNAESDTVATMILPELEVRQQGVSAIRKNTTGNIDISSQSALTLNRTFGEADFIGAIKNISGINTAGDYGAGISVMGADPSQTIYSIDGAPVIFPYRFGGIFSTFNTPHFASMRFTPSALPASEAPRIGGALLFIPADGGNKLISGTANVGILSSSATIRTSLSRRFFAVASGRVSYIDQLYGRLLKGSTSYLRYTFYDLNLTLGYRPTERDTITASLFHNRDRIHYDDTNYSMTSGMHWRNLTAGISWHHGGTTPINLNIYYSGFSTALTIDMPQFMLNGPSSLRTVGARVLLSSNIGKRITLSYGAHTEWGHTLPQYAWLDYYDDESLTKASSRMPLNYLTARAFASAIIRISNTLTAEVGISAGIFHSRRIQTNDTETSGYSAVIPDPRATLRWRTLAGQFMLHAGGYSQYLHQVGFSDLGLASDFWIAACKAAPMQHAWTFNMTWNRSLEFWGLSAEVGVYFSIIDHQPEYRGQLLEVIDTSYDPFSRLSITSGTNFGVNAGLRRDFGQFTGNVGYAYGTGRRHIQAQEGSWRSHLDPGHSVVASAVWHEGRHWEVGATFRYAQGRPYTPVESLYLISGNLAMQYGKRNGSRLPDYQRLDLFATYILQTGQHSNHPLRHLINISIINAYGHRNTEMQYFLIDPSTGDYFLKRLNSLYRFLPSISYTIQF